MAGVILGGPTAWKVRVKGDVVCAYHWVNGEPAMCLYPREKRTAAAAFVLCLSAAHKYALANGHPTKYLIEQAGRAAVLMGMEAQMFTVRGIADVIIDGLEDLVQMPPEPEAFAKGKPGQRVGEIVLKSGDKVLAGGEVDVPTMLDISMTEH